MFFTTTHKAHSCSWFLSCSGFFKNYEVWDCCCCMGWFSISFLVQGRVLQTEMLSPRKQAIWLVLYLKYPARICFRKWLFALKYEFQYRDTESRLFFRVTDNRTTFLLKKRQCQTHGLICSWKRLKLHTFTNTGDRWPVKAFTGASAVFKCRSYLLGCLRGRGYWQGLCSLSPRLSLCCAYFYGCCFSVKAKVSCRQDCGVECVLEFAASFPTREPFTKKCFSPWGLNSETCAC